MSILGIKFFYGATGREYEGGGRICLQPTSILLGQLKASRRPITFGHPMNKMFTQEYWTSSFSQKYTLSINQTTAESFHFND